MNRTLLLSAFILLQLGATAQCTGQIPANATVVTSSTAGSVVGSNQTFWVCGTAFQQIFTGSNNQIYIESGAFVSVNGNGNTVRYKGNIPLGVFGSNNVLHVTAASAVTDLGSGNTINACGADAVVFNYSTAPSTGCSTVGITEELPASATVFYDPAGDRLVITSPDLVVEQVRVMDMRGSEVAYARGTGTPIALNTLTTGTYIVLLATNKGNVMRRFVK